MTTTEQPDYSKTVNLPKTDFPQKGNLPVREPEMLARWNELKVSEQLSARTDNPPFVLHDGPPYANGNIHIGHTLNKVLKDIIIRYKTMNGFRAHYVPGWDCHGLPIEQKVVDDLRKKKTYADKTPLEIRRLCAEYASQWIDAQREQFKRLGVGGDWDHPYITMDPKFEVAILDALKVLVQNGYVYKGLKVVHWDPIFETALAEAEIEYNDDHTSPSIYVKFPFKSTPPVAALQGGNASIVIWTTTPWTLPANLGVTVHPDFQYYAYKVKGEVLVVARGLFEAFQKDTGLTGGEVLGEFLGRELDRQVCAHPLIEGKDSLVMVGEHVTLEQGSGCVHTAPGHGVEDFMIGAQYGLPVFNPVDEGGRFTDEYPDMQGMNVFGANEKIIDVLKEKGLLLANKPYKHSYPYSWRTKKPVIMRATEQWFMNVDKDGLREKALANCDKVDWVPNWGYDRIYNMLKSRPDWCLSRQRSWGVPIPSINDTKTGESMLLPEVIENLNRFVASEGTDAWYTHPVEDFLPETMKGEAGRYEKEFNCLDVWFDSGSTHLAVLNENYGLTWPADLYLEGSDQHRGWFQSSLWVSLGVKGAAPYRQVLTHGFVLDEKGQPMSKSLGNVISPLDVIKDKGADVIRMWVSSEDYRGDVSISQNAIEQITQAYRRIRNTLRFILGNVYDFDPAQNAVAPEQLQPDDRWLLHQLNELIKSVTRAYEKYEFHRVYQLVSGFCVTELGALYLSFIKDRLYCSAPDDAVRRSSQTVLHHIGSVLPRLMAPIMVFTADESWRELPGRETENVHLAEFPKVRADWQNDELAADFKRLLVLRDEVMTQIEALRSAKTIGSSLDAKVTLQGVDPETISFLGNHKDILPAFFIVSHVQMKEGEPGSVKQDLRTSGLLVSVHVEKADGDKCPRCWNWSVQIGTNPSHPALCARCADVMRRIG